jgi:DNA recombination protein RmuC
MDFILYALIISVLVSVTVALLIMKRSNRGVNNEENIFLKEYIKKLENEKDELNKMIVEKEGIIEELTKEKFEEAKKYVQQIASMQAQLEAQKESNERLKTEFEEQSKRLEESLDKIMRQHIEEKLKKLDETSIKNLDGVLKPLKENIENFRKRVEESQEYSTKKFAELSKEIEQIVKAGMNISEEAKNLANALKGKKQMQGRWGELVLETILETSGLLKGQHYETQESFQDESGKRKRPDVIVKLPGNKSIIIDSKVSLNNYDSFVRAELDEEREKYAKLLASDFKNHIDTLSGKDYAHYKSGTLQYVFMFVPIEGAFSVAMQANPSLYEYALEKNIVIVNPSTLIVTLRTVYLYWQSVESNTQAVKLFEEAGKLYDKIASFTNTFKTLGNQIDTVSRTYSKALGQLSEGKGNILSRTENLKRLGARTTKSLKDSKIDYQDLDLNDVEAEVIDEDIYILEKQ